MVGTARCAVPVAERSVRRRNNGRFTTFVPSCRTGTPQRGIPTTQTSVNYIIPVQSGFLSFFVLSCGTVSPECDHLTVVLDAVWLMHDEHVASERHPGGIAEAAGKQRGAAFPQFESRGAGADPVEF